MACILLIDDDTELTELLQEVLHFEGFEVIVANNGEIALNNMSDRIDLILLDVMMPKLNGLETLKQLRAKWQTPVLMLSAKGEEIDRVIGLELGADDYLPKPFSDRELLARIRAILRRTNTTEHSQAKSDCLEYHAFKLFAGKQEAFFEQTLLNLTTTEFLLLSLFIQNPGKVLTKETISLEVLGKRLAPFDRAVDMHVSNLRKKLPIKRNGKPRIKTLRGRGYLLMEEDE